MQSAIFCLFRSQSADVFHCHTHMKRDKLGLYSVLIRKTLYQYTISIYLLLCGCEMQIFYRPAVVN